MQKTLTLILHPKSEKPPKAGCYLVWLSYNGMIVECYCRYHKFSALGFYHDYIKHEVQLGNYLYWTENVDVRKIPLEIR